MTTVNRLCMVFPGQGSQSVGMLGNLANNYPIVKQTFAEASEILGYDLWDLVQTGPADDLGQTQKTQPAMLAAGVAVWRVWQDMKGGTPAVMAGHSLGEYTALVCAGALDYTDAIGLVADRGRYMQEAVPQGQGGMAAILGLDDEQVRQACRDASANGVVEAVNFNAPGQVVIAGAKTAVELACEKAKQSGAKRALPLPVSVPSHCSLMQPAAERLRVRLADMKINQVSMPVIHNVDLSLAADPSDIRERLVEQLYRPVRWVETVQAIATRGVVDFIEAGPGKVLTGLNKRIVSDINGLAVFDTTGLNAALEAVK